MYYSLVFFRECHPDYQDALKCGAVYTTGSSVDSLSNRTGLWDMEDVLSTLTDCIGDTVNIGVVNGAGVFVSLDYITDVMQDDEDETYNIIEAYKEV